MARPSSTTAALERTMSDATLPPPPAFSAENLAQRIRQAAEALNRELRRAAEKGIGCDLDVRIGDLSARDDEASTVAVHMVRVRPYQLL